jgi:S-adenosylmethionine hydrolase
VILTINPGVRIVDVTHDIEAYSILEGALVVRGISRYYPRGTIHVAVVDPGVGGSRRAAVMSSGGCMYVGPDNGLFALAATNDEKWEMREISNPEFTFRQPHPTFHGRDLFAPAAAHLSRGKPFADVGPLIRHPATSPLPGVIHTSQGLEAQVIHVDSFGNLMTNVETTMLDRQVATVTMGDVKIGGISRFFGEVDEGRPLALINSLGFLEIAVNLGNAARDLGIGPGAHVRIGWA